MASLSEEMRNKRDVKRRSTVLIVDKDLGNIGLYKSILAMEYELDCVSNIRAAVERCQQKTYDVIVADDGLGIGGIADFYSEAQKLYGRGELIFLVLSEPSDKENIMKCMCFGATGYIAKPFTKDGMSGKIYDAIKEKRQREVRNKVLILDHDKTTLCQMKDYLKDKYAVEIMNDCHNVAEYLKHNIPGLIIFDIDMPDMSGIDACEDIKNRDEFADIPVLFMTDKPDADSVTRCARFKPEGFLVKPVDKDTILNTLDRIFLIESYSKTSDRR